MVGVLVFDYAKVLKDERINGENIIKYKRNNKEAKVKSIISFQCFPH